MKKYLIHDNGGRPFAVIINNGRVTVYNNDYNEDIQEYQLGKKLLELVPIKILIGKDFDYYNTGHVYDGNSILLLIKETKKVYTYICIGWNIHQFETEEKVLKYNSFIGNSDVPYPYAITKNYTYLTTEFIRIANKDYNNEDPYDIYYFSKEKPAIKKYRKKMLFKRR